MLLFKETVKEKEVNVNIQGDCEGKGGAVHQFPATPAREREWDHRNTTGKNLNFCYRIINEKLWIWKIC